MCRQSSQIPPFLPLSLALFVLMGRRAENDSAASLASFVIRALASLSKHHRGRVTNIREGILPLRSTADRKTLANVQRSSGVYKTVRRLTMYRVADLFADLRGQLAGDMLFCTTPLRVVCDFGSQHQCCTACP